MPRGKVEFYNKVRKFGLIIPDGDDQYNFMFNGDYDFEYGDIVEFEQTIAGEKGPKAVNIRKVTPSE
jgi:cold shock CspA family protein